MIIKKNKKILSFIVFKKELFVGGEFHQVGLYEVVDVTIHDSTHVAGLVVSAVVLDAAVVEDVAAYLATPLYLLLAVLDFALLLAAVLELLVVED